MHVFMSVAVWRAHMFSCGWPAKHVHKGLSQTNHVLKFILNYRYLWRATPSTSHEMELFCFVSHRTLYMSLSCKSYCTSSMDIEKFAKFGTKTSDTDLPPIQITGQTQVCVYS